MKNATTEIEKKSGYKKTKLGWIPDNWQLNKMEMIVNVIMGQSPDGSTYNVNGNGIALINGPTEFTKRHPVKKQWTTKPTKLSQNGDILICVRGSSTGRINISDDEYCIGRGVAAIRSKSNTDQIFIEYQLQYQLPRLLRLTSGSTFPNINSQNIKNLRIPTPPLPEQKKIAEILSTWGHAIETLEQLIAKKEELKRGLIQELLTGKTRYPGFEGEWERVPVGKMFEFLRSISVSRSNLHKNDSGDTVLNLHYGDLHVKYNSQTILDVSKSHDIPAIINGYGYPSNIDYAKDGDVIIVDASEDYEGVGECVELKNIGDKKLTAGLHTFLLRDKKDVTVDGFRSLVFEQPEVKKQLKRVVTGSNVYGLSKTNLSKIPIYLPSKDEQRKIVEVLQAVENEINDFKSMEKVLRLQKRGLMQQLLSGKVRVNGVFNY